MHRKNYREIADSIRRLKKSSLLPEGWDRVVENLIQVFKKDNPNFSEQKFWDYIDR